MQNEAKNISFSKGNRKENLIETPNARDVSARMNENMHTFNSKQYILFANCPYRKHLNGKKTTVEKRLLRWNLTVIELCLARKKKLHEYFFICLSLRSKYAANRRERERGRDEERAKMYVFRCTRMHSSCSRQCLCSVRCAQSNPFYFPNRLKPERRPCQNLNMRILVAHCPHTRESDFSCYSRQQTNAIQ